MPSPRQPKTEQAQVKQRERAGLGNVVEGVAIALAAENALDGQGQNVSKGRDVKRKITGPFGVNPSGWTRVLGSGRLPGVALLELVGTDVAERTV